MLRREAEGVLAMRLSELRLSFSVDLERKKKQEYEAIEKELNPPLVLESCNCRKSGMEDWIECVR